MTREFIITKEFDRMWKLIGLDDNDLSSLEIYLCKNPKVGAVMEGTGGLRKSCAGLWMEKVKVVERE